MKKLDELLQWFLGFILGVFVIALLLGLPVMLLWNYVMVGELHLPILDFGGALALNFLFAILLNPRLRIKNNEN